MLILPWLETGQWNESTNPIRDDIVNNINITTAIPSVATVGEITDVAQDDLEGKLGW